MKGRSPLGRDFAEGFETSVAMGAAKGREKDLFGFGLGAEAEEMADAPERLVSGGAEPAIVADAHEAFRQNMNQPAANELDRLERNGPPNAGVAVFAAQEDASVAVVTLEASFGKGGFADVGGCVSQGGFTPADVLAIDAPLCPPYFCVHPCMESGMPFGQSFKKEIADAVNQRSPRDEEVVVFWVGDAATAGSQTDRRHDQVDMRMMEHLTGPGVQHSEEAGLGAKVARVSAKIAQSAGGGLEEDCVSLSRGEEEQMSQLFGYGRGDHVICHG